MPVAERDNVEQRVMAQNLTHELHELRNELILTEVQSKLLKSSSILALNVIVQLEMKSGGHSLRHLAVVQA